MQVQSLFIWLYVLTFIVFTIYGAAIARDIKHILAIIFADAFLGLLVFPGIFIFINYRKYSLYKEFVITQHFLELNDKTTSKRIQINKSDIVSIEFHTCSSSKLPWGSYEYFRIIDNEQKSIIITSFIMDMSNFWMDPLTRISSSKMFKRMEQIYPIINSQRL